MLTFISNLLARLQPCGYCDRGRTSLDPNDICSRCWREMEARS